MEKAPDAFRTISEVADELDVPQHVLRFWETRFAQIKPMKRGGGRRYYRPDDVDLLRGIRHLLYGQGYTIRGVQRLLKDKGVKYVQVVWSSETPAPPQDDMADEHDHDEDVAGAELVAEAEDETSIAPDDLPDASPEVSTGAGVAEGLTQAQRDRLAAALQDLEEGRRALEAALKDD